MPPSHSFQHPAEDRLARVAEQALGFRLGGDSTYCAAVAEHLSQPIMSTGRFRDTAAHEGNRPLREGFFPSMNKQGAVPVFRLVATLPKAGLHHNLGYCRVLRYFPLSSRA